MDTINSIGPIQPGKEPQKTIASQPSGTNQPDFKATLSRFMADVNTMQTKADESIEKMAAGEITDVHQVMNTVQEANLAFNMMMEIRNKVVDAYQELMRLRF
ncbi:MAG: flagellar hook-basal body complex protein FliE [Chitinivibrionales bacterium]|nr:flagellar hook-basal body complex protein FliE [Chitinivibrionales bacterium]